MNPPAAKKSRRVCYQTRSAQRTQMMDTLLVPAFEVIFDHGSVAWFEAVRVGACCTSLHGVWIQKQDRICEKLLTSINQLNRANVCSYCLKRAFPASERVCQCNEEDQRVVLAELDPRALAGYEQLSTIEKCKAMVGFSASLVKNFQSHFNYHRLTDESCLPRQYQPGDLDWYFPDFEFLADNKPHRLVFMCNVMAADMAHDELYEDNVYRFEEAFDGTGFDPNTGSSFRHLFSESLEAMMPGTDAALAQYIQNSRKKFGRIWKNLGPALTRKLDFFAPFLASDLDDVLFPKGMERISTKEKQTIQNLAYERPL